MPVILPEYCQELLKALPKPSAVWKYMLAVTQVPRGSNGDNENFRHKKILAFLKQQAEELQCETFVDKGDNLIIHKAAYPGLENKPVVCLQCHMDMVVEKNDDVNINFETDPLTPRIVDNKWLMATGTSLGADNGIGIATCFAILEDKSLKHGPLEVLVTRDEETGMFGATDLEPGVLKAKYMINVDSEEENAICIGCSGGFTVHMTLPTTREAISDHVFSRITLNNFCGGHSGCDIDLGRANPLQVMGRLVAATAADMRVVSVTCGTADNAIPRKCVMDVAIPKEKQQMFKEQILAAFDAFAKEYRSIETDATIDVTPLDETPDETPLSLAESERLVSFIAVCPFGVQRYSPAVKSDVETSMTCAIARSASDNVTFIASVRSSSNTQMDMMYSKLRCLCSMCGMKISERKAPYPGWEPKADSPLTLAVVEAYKQAVGVNPRVYSIHAGLECGLFMEKYPDLDCTSVGPTILSPHSPQERLEIETVPRFYKTLLVALENLAK